MVRLHCLRVLVLAALVCIPAAVPAAQNASSAQDTELKNALRRVFKDHPELVLDVLRENSVTVLEIAQKGSQERQFKAMRAQWREDLKNPKNIKYNRPVLGAANAPVTIVAYSDYTCPYCADAAETIHQVLAARKGTVRFIFKNFPRDHPLARMASEYVVAAFIIDEAKGWAYHDVVFGNQMRLLKEGEGFLRAEAHSLGFNLQKLESEARGRKVREIIEEDIAEARRIGVPGTPYHLVNDLSVRGGLPLPAFLEAVDTALASKRKGR